MKEDKRTGWGELFDKGRAPILLLFLGILLLLAAGRQSGTEKEKTGAEFAAEEKKLAEVLADIDGTGRTAVLLRTDGRENCSGAVIVCDGAESAAVRLKVVNAVSAYTGLGSDRIIVLKMKGS